MNNQNKNIKGQLLDTINKRNNANNTTEILDEIEIKINYFSYILGMAIILIIYFGPYFYYKIIKKKSFNPQRKIGVKHAI